MKTIIYFRTSTEEQNPQNQLKQCIELIKEGQEYIIVEEQQSGFKDEEREKWDGVIKAIKKGRCKHLICWDLDRLYRNRNKLVELFQLCKAYKCAIHSYRQKWLEDINKVPHPWNEIIYDLLINIMGWMAEEESIKKSQRIKAAISDVKRDGITYSKQGNKWGRKGISTFKRNRINQLRGEGKSIREIAQELSLSVGCVHKSLIESS